MIEGAHAEAKAKQMEDELKGNSSRAPVDATVIAQVANQFGIALAEVLKKTDCMHSSHKSESLKGDAFVSAIQSEYSEDGVIWPWMDSAKSKMLKDDATKVTLKEAIEAKPANVKEARRAFYETEMGVHPLMEKFTDGLSHSGYVEQRKLMVTKLAAWCLVVSEDVGSIANESHAKRALTTSIDYWYTREGYTRIGMVRSKINAKGTHMEVQEILDYIDSVFSAPTESERVGEYADRLGKLTIENGVTPTQMITDAQLIFTTKFGDKSHLVDTEVRAFVVDQLKKQSKDHACLAEFVKVLQGIDLNEVPTDRWVAQFRVLERSTDFKTGLEAAKRKGKKSSSERRIDAILGFSPGAFEDPTGDDNANPSSDDQSALLQKILGAIVDVAPDHFMKGKQKLSESELLQRMIAAVSNKKGWLDDSWVKDNGVSGYAAPLDKSRRPLHVGRVCALAKSSGVVSDLVIPDKCPKDKDAYVGPECPCAALRGIPDDAWFWHPDSDQFKSGKPGYARVKPPDLVKSGHYHKLGNCVYIHKLAHEVARKTGDHSILNPLPRDVKDCMTM
jgi:hypothetical protein